MEGINERFKALRIKSGKSQEEWGKILGITKSGVSNLETGKRNVTEQHLIMLGFWQEKTVNIDWLRTGEGDMFIKLDPDRELNIQVARLVGEGSEFKKTMVSMLLKMSEEQWKLVEDFVDALYVAKQKENTRDE